MSTLGCVFILTLELAQGAHPELFLDMTTPQVKHMDRARTIGCAGGGGVYGDHTPFRPPELTLALDIEWLNQDHFRVGDEAVVEVRLTNTGDKPVVLPWNPDSDIVYGKDCRGLGKANPPATLEGSLALKIVASEGQGGFVAAHRLFGLLDDAATYRILAPRQSARIRVSGDLYLPQAASATSSPGTTNRFKVIAVFDLSDSRLPNAYKTVLSSNSIIVGVDK